MNVLIYYKKKSVFSLVCYIKNKLVWWRLGGTEPWVRLYADNMEPAWDSLCAPPPHTGAKSFIWNSLFAPPPMHVGAKILAEKRMLRLRPKTPY